MERGRQPRLEPRAEGSGNTCTYSRCGSGRDFLKYCIYWTAVLEVVVVVLILMNDARSALITNEIVLFKNNRTLCFTSTNINTCYL